jgi:hypothetical protein
METVCSFLIGPKSNSGYHFVGRVTDLSNEDTVKLSEYKTIIGHQRLT